MRTFFFAVLVAALVQCCDAHAFKVGGMTWPTGAGTVGQCIKTNGISTLFYDDVLSPDSLSATAPITYNPSTGVIAIPVATSVANGYLSSANWTTFNNKQPAGNYITALTGEGTASGPGSVAFTLGATIAGATTFSTSLTSPIFKSSTSTPATAGQVRLAKTDFLEFRGTENTFNNTMGVVNLEAGIDMFKFDTTGGAGGIIALGDLVSTFGLFLGKYFQGGNVYSDDITVSGTLRPATYTSMVGSGSDIEASVGRFSTDTTATEHLFFKARGTVSSPTIVSSGDSLGTISAVGFDGTDFEYAAKINFIVNGTPGNDDMPGSIAFQVTPDGSITPANALVILNTKAAAFVGNITNSFAGTANTAGLLLSGAPFTGGSSTTTKPHLHIANAGTSNNWSTSGTSLGINPASGFAGNLIDAQVNAVAKFKVDSTGGTTQVGHLKYNGTAPTATVNANAGTGATCTLSNSSDVAGTMNLTTTATAPAAGEQCKVNFNVAYGVAPICIFSPASANAAAFQVTSQTYQTTTTAKLSINFGVADAVGHAYVWSYYCAETQ